MYTRIEMYAGVTRTYVYRSLRREDVRFEPQFSHILLCVAVGNAS